MRLKKWKSISTYRGASIDVNVTANANESILVPVGANANTIELTEDVDIPSQNGSAKDISHSHSTYCV